MLWIWSKSVTKKFSPNFQVFQAIFCAIMSRNSSKSVTKKFWPNFQVFQAIFGAIFVHFKIHFLTLFLDQSGWNLKYTHWWSLSINIVNFCTLQNSFFDLIFWSFRLKLEIDSLMVPFYLCCEFHQNPWQKNFG